MIQKNSPLCTGCGACVAVCPKKCISMEINSIGEYMPIIEKEKCINCQACNKVCLVENDFSSGNPIGESYFGWINELYIRKKCSSGGIAYAISKEFILHGGVVVGCVFGENWLPQHEIIKDVNYLYKIQGSKYTESKIYHVLPEVLKLLKEERKVLFIGLPCQVKALRLYIQETYENLYCLEVFCHGAPRIGIFQKYINYMQSKYGQLNEFNFRSKNFGWQKASYSMCFNNRNIIQRHEHNIFHLMFGYHNSLRNSCFNCKSRGDKRSADMSLGDFWGVERYYKNIDLENGVSAIFINSEKGKQLLEDIKPKVTLKRCKKEEVLDKNRWFLKNYPIPSNQSVYNFDYINMKTDVFLKKYMFLYKLWFPIKRKLKLK